MISDKLVQIGADAAHIALQMEYGADFNRNVLLRLTRAALAATITDLEQERDALKGTLCEEFRISALQVEQIAIKDAALRELLPVRDHIKGLETEVERLRGALIKVHDWIANWDCDGSPVVALDAIVLATLETKP